MIDVQTAPSPQPSVFDSVPAITPAAASTSALTRPTGTVLHVEADAEYVMVGRSLIGTCTREEWESPAQRKLAIARAWEQGIPAIRAEGEDFVAWRPVTLYRHPRTLSVAFADISLPGKPGTYVTADGKPVRVSPFDLALHRTDRTSYARWAEGPLPHLSLEMAAGHTPDEDRDIQYLRNLNSGMRELIDGALAPSEWAATANTKTDDGLVNFRVRGVFRRLEYRRLISKQTGHESSVLIDGASVEVLPEVVAAPTSEAALDALLETH